MAPELILPLFYLLVGIVLGCLVQFVRQVIAAGDEYRRKRVADDFAATLFVWAFAWPFMLFGWIAIASTAGLSKAIQWAALKTAIAIEKRLPEPKK